MTAPVPRPQPTIEQVDALLELIGLDLVVVDIEEMAGVHHPDALILRYSDWFVPGGDGESIQLADAPTILDVWRSADFDGIRQWIADRRGVPNVHWRTGYLAVRADVLAWITKTPLGRTWSDALDHWPAIDPDQLLGIWQDLLGEHAVAHTDSGGTRVKATP